jgi:hypothetical protein
MNTTFDFSGGFSTNYCKSINFYEGSLFYELLIDNKDNFAGSGFDPLGINPFLTFSTG